MSGMSGKRVVVTGGSRGIGLAIAGGFAEAGAEVTIASRDADACARGAASIGAHGRAADVNSPEDLDVLFAEVGERGGCDVLVCCAGVSGGGSAADIDRADLQRMIDIHVHGAIEAARRAARQMRDSGGGAILFVTSVWGLRGQPGTLAYGVAKAAMAHAVKVLAIEWARDGIRVNGLAPGFVDTDMTADLDEAVRDKLLKRVPLRRAARAEEMVGPAMLLCSDAGSYVTGQILVVDGGESARA